MHIITDTHNTQQVYLAKRVRILTSLLAYLISETKPGPKTAGGSLTSSTTPAPTDPTSVEYGVSTTYHWPQFDKNVTDQYGQNPISGFTEVNGPGLFQKAIQLSSIQEQVGI